MINETLTPSVSLDSSTDDLFNLETIEPGKVENDTLRAALQRIKERCSPDAHTSYYTKHSSHSRYSKGW